jgi:hypothetical protein
MVQFQQGKVMTSPDSTDKLSPQAGLNSTVPVGTKIPAEDGQQQPILNENLQRLLKPDGSDQVAQLIKDYYRNSRH